VKLGLLNELPHKIHKRELNFKQNYGIGALLFVPHDRSEILQSFPPLPFNNLNPVDPSCGVELFRKVDLKGHSTGHRGQRPLLLSFEACFFRYAQSQRLSIHPVVEYATAAGFLSATYPALRHLTKRRLTSL